jgi:hypothetical protein
MMVLIKNIAVTNIPFLVPRRNKVKIGKEKDHTWPVLFNPPDANRYTNNPPAKAMPT